MNSSTCSSPVGYTQSRPRAASGVGVGRRAGSWERGRDCFHCRPSSTVVCFLTLCLQDHPKYTKPKTTPSHYKIETTARKREPKKGRIRWLPSWQAWAMRDWTEGGIPQNHFTGKTQSTTQGTIFRWRATSCHTWLRPRAVSMPGFPSEPLAGGARRGRGSCQLTWIP